MASPAPLASGLEHIKRFRTHLVNEVLRKRESMALGLSPSAAREVVRRPAVGYSSP